MNNYYVGRNIKQNEKGYYIVVFSDRDLKLSRYKHFDSSCHATYAQAKLQMDKLINSGSTWFNAHFDPTI